MAITIEVKLAVWFICLILTIFSGLLIFSKGFLLTKRVITDNNTCMSALCDNHSTTVTQQLHDSNAFNKLNHHDRTQHYKKCIIIVIDALRFDFVFSNTTVTSKPYHNKLSVILEELKTAPLNNALFKFIADPPTTTLQRLKGLTTGSLPTFIDAGSNFASPAINEDNIIDQMRRSNKRIVFMGDDTWVSLFPNSFTESYAFPSFNVFDLHTVDNGILQRLSPTIKQGDWDVIIAHFLGVDHCGHKYGPNHPAMEQKLLQMNEMLKSVLDGMDEDTVLFVLGDHGMTSTGDHGGDSFDEVEAALFVHSKRRLLVDELEQPVAVKQIDIVPTISLLLGFPIPFCNLGKVITNVFPTCVTCALHHVKLLQSLYTVSLLRTNAHQILRYMKKYSSISNEISLPMYSNIRSRLSAYDSVFQRIYLSTNNAQHNSTETTESLVHLERSYSDLIDTVYTICSSTWAKFNDELILSGLIISVCILSFMAILFSSNLKRLSRYADCVLLVQTPVVLIFAVLMIINSQYSNVIVFIFTVIEIVLLCLYGYSAAKTYHCHDFTKRYLSVDLLSALLVVFLLAASHLSNSFTVFNDSIILFCSQTLILCVILKIIKLNYSSGLRVTRNGKLSQKRLKNRFDIFSRLTSHQGLALLACLITCVLIRVQQNFFTCREEQKNCENIEITQPLTNVVNPTSKNTHYFFSVVSLILYICLPTIWLLKQGHLNGSGIFQFCVRTVFPVCGVCVCFYWAVRALPSETLDSMPAWQVVIFPRIVYLLVMLSLCLHIKYPLSVFITTEHRSSLEIGERDLSIPVIYQYMKQSYNNKLDDSSMTMAYGVATIYSSAIVFIITLVGVMLCLLLGEGPSASLSVITLTHWLVLEIYAYLSSLEKSTDVSFSVISLWALLGHLGFYSTGHQCSFSAIRWEAAFVGYHGDHSNNILPAIMIAANTFPTYILNTFSCVLLVFWPKFGGTMFYAFEKCKPDRNEGDLWFSYNATILWCKIYKVIYGILLVNSMQVVGAAIAAAILRRHLMVWKIFAQVFIFKLLSLVIVSVSLILVLLFIKRLHKCINDWSRSVSNKAL